MVDRHPDESGIIYCIRRTDVEEIAAHFASLGYQALPYHAGMSDDDRRRNQDAFINDRCRIIVATVAFGMGIDKSNVRYVIHAAAPKSLESYQQESGRAGRDGLEAECWLFHSAGDFQTWRRLQQELPPQAFEIAMKLLAGIDGFANGVACRHRALTAYFGEELPSENCGACDVCLAELDLVDDPLVLAQKILSCVVRVEERFGGDYVAQVLVGSSEERILQRGHNRLSTWGILGEHNKKSVRAWIDQLVHQSFLETLRRVQRAAAHAGRLASAPRRSDAAAPEAGQAEVAARIAGHASSRGKASTASCSTCSAPTAAAQSHERGVPPYVVFSDATLRDLARHRPTTPRRTAHHPRHRREEESPNMATTCSTKSTASSANTASLWRPSSAAGRAIQTAGNQCQRDQGHRRWLRAALAKIRRHNLEVSGVKQAVAVRIAHTRRNRLVEVGCQQCEVRRVDASVAIHVAAQNGNNPQVDVVDFRVVLYVNVQVLVQIHRGNQIRSVAIKIEVPDWHRAQVEPEIDPIGIEILGSPIGLQQSLLALVTDEFNPIRPDLLPDIVCEIEAQRVIGGGRLTDSSQRPHRNMQIRLGDAHREIIERIGEPLVDEKCVVRRVRVGPQKSLQRWTWIDRLGRQHIAVLNSAEKVERGCFKTRYCGASEHGNQNSDDGWEDYACHLISILFLQWVKVEP